MAESNGSDKSSLDDLFSSTGSSETPPAPDIPVATAKVPLISDAATTEATATDLDPSIASILESSASARPSSRSERVRGRRISTEDEVDEEEEEEEEEEEGEASDLNPMLLNGAICLGKGVGAAVSGGVMGALWGAGSGLFKKQGVKVALAEGGKSAKTFALMGGMHSAVTCSLESLRGGRDAWHAGVAGCATGLVVGADGGVQSALQSCAGFGVFSYLVENLQPSAVAAPLPHVKHSTRHVDRLARSHFPATPTVLEPLVRPVRMFHTRLKKAESRRVREAIKRELRK